MINPALAVLYALVAFNAFIAVITQDRFDDRHMQQAQLFLIAALILDLKLHLMRNKKNE